MRNLLAFDLGASNGRAILGQFDGEKITMRELHRFENNYIELNGVFYWDLPYLYDQLKKGFLAFRQADIGELDCFGIDTWGVDYGLLDRNDQLLSNPRSYLPDALRPQRHRAGQFQHALSALPAQARGRSRAGKRRDHAADARSSGLLPDG